MSDSARRILFALVEPGYFRFYGSTIIELARRGWDVELVYDKPDKRGSDLRVPPNAGDRVRSVGMLPGDASSIAKAIRVGVDCLRYLEPAFEHAEYLRRRAEKKLPTAIRFMARINRLPRPVVSAAIGLTRITERCLPINRDVVEFIREHRPDVVVVSPVVIIGDSGARETEVIKAARAFHIPTAVAVASWDHLTSKGLIRVVPDAVMVWNEVQKHEAERLHRIPRRRIEVTGAQSLDRWFDRPQPNALDTFRASLGIERGRRVVLWVGSSPNMAPGDSEVQFVRRWLAALRASSSADVHNSFVIVRPHPGNTEPWQDADLRDPHAVIYPKSYAARVLLTEDEVQNFWYSIVASSAVIGINTTAMIEAAVVRRPVFSIRDDSFARSQQQTLHFSYLSAADGGFAVVSDSLVAHVRQLERLFMAGEPDLRESDGFVARFVRPLGMEMSATTHLCDAIERLAARRHGTDAPVRSVATEAAATACGVSRRVSGR